MLVRFISSETGEIIMFADVARTLLTAIGKGCSARGVFTQEEMLPSAAVLRRMVDAAGEPPQDDEELDDGQEVPVPLGRRAWPLIDMLERSARGGARASILWQAPADF